MVHNIPQPNWAPIWEYVPIPLGSSSEAPVTRPGPSRERNAFSEKLKPACGAAAHGCWVSVSGDGTGTARDGDLVPFADICAELKLTFGCVPCELQLAFCWPSETGKTDIESVDKEAGVRFEIAIRLPLRETDRILHSLAANGDSSRDSVDSVIRLASSACRSSESPRWLHPQKRYLVHQCAQECLSPFASSRNCRCVRTTGFHLLGFDLRTSSPRIQVCPSRSACL